MQLDKQSVGLSQASESLAMSKESAAINISAVRKADKNEPIVGDPDKWSVASTVSDNKSAIASILDESDPAKQSAPDTADKSAKDENKKDQVKLTVNELKVFNLQNDLKVPVPFE